MPTLHIQHSVPRFEAWLEAFEKDPLDRKASGVRRYVIRRSVTDPTFVMLDLEFDTLEEAEGLLARLRRLWAGPGASVMRDPAAWITEIVNAQSV